MKTEQVIVPFSTKKGKLQVVVDWHASVASCWVYLRSVGDTVLCSAMGVHYPSIGTTAFLSSRLGAVNDPS